MLRTPRKIKDKISSIFSMEIVIVEVCDIFIRKTALLIVSTRRNEMDAEYNKYCILRMKSIASSQKGS